MAAVTDVTITAGVPTAGTGTVSTLDKFDSAAGVSATRALTVQGIGSGTAMPVSIASVPSHAVTNAGTFVTQENGAALTALQLIDDTVVSTGTALGTTKVGLAGASVTTSAPTYTTGQVNALSMDTSGALRVTGAGGGTQYTEDAAAATDPVGNMMVAVRRDTLSTSEVSADGDNIALKATNKGKLHVAAETRFGDIVADTGSGTIGSATQRVAIASDSPGVLPTSAPGTLGSSGASMTVVNPSNYETVAASQTAQALGATGATGDFINGLLVIPATTSPGNVLLLDNATSITVFTGGASSVSNLVPFFIPLGMTSVSGAWKITTGANVSCIGVGKFT